MRRRGRKPKARGRVTLVVRAERCHFDAKVERCPMPAHVHAPRRSQDEFYLCEIPCRRSSVAFCDFRTQSPGLRPSTKVYGRFVDRRAEHRQGGNDFDQASCPSRYFAYLCATNLRHRRGNPRDELSCARRRISQLRRLGETLCVMFPFAVTLPTGPLPRVTCGPFGASAEHEQSLLYSTSPAPSNDLGS